MLIGTKAFEQKLVRVFIRRRIILGLTIAWVNGNGFCCLKFKEVLVMCRVNIGQPFNGDWPVVIDGDIALNIRPAEGKPNIDDWPFWVKSSQAFSTSLMGYGMIDECIDYFRIETGSEPRVFTVAYMERAGVNLPVLSDVYVEQGNFTVKYVSIK